MSRFALIGLDGAPPKFLFDSWRDELPNIRSVMNDGIHGILQSTIPLGMIPGWTSMMTSQDPGQLGIYGPRGRKGREYGDPAPATSEQVRAKTVWNVLSNHRLNSLVIGVPQTYPPKPLKGVLAAGPYTPGKDAHWTHPREIAREIEESAGGEYVLGIPDFRSLEEDWLFDQIEEMTRKRFAVFRRFAAKKEFDLMVLAESGPDLIHRSFWRYMDPEHRLHQADHKHADSIRKYYRFLDEELGRLLDSLPSDTSTMIVSEHGAARSDGAICINEWLMNEKLLALKEKPEEPAAPAADHIDWGKTRAWAEGGHLARIYLNVKGREPKGAVPEADYESYREELKARIAAIPDDKGDALKTEVLKPEEIYRTVSGIAPDLLVLFGDLRWRASGLVGTGSVSLLDKEAGLDDANHNRNGILIWDHPAKVRPKAKDPYSIFDIAPTIVRFFGLDVPAHWIGEPLF
ncbi:MAG: alkaline phosphatase family protein [Candidatus Eisenbacteria bacterium]|nr:alkaline phosphatase family protein [Candidatus Eisenbacteria bacterium]